MPTPPPADARAAGRELLAARVRRVRAIRRRVTAASLATFALAWGVIAWTGSMGANAAATGSTQAANVGSTASTAAGSSDDSHPADSAATASTGGGLGSVTTAQS